jgi:hypothetical protein
LVQCGSRTDQPAPLFSGLVGPGRDKTVASIERESGRAIFCSFHVHGLQNRLVETTADGQVASGVIRGADEGGAQKRVEVEEKLSFFSLDRT